MSPLRAAMHIHSAWSYDASWPLTRLAEKFSARGYDVLLMSEHDKGFDQPKWDEYQDACRQASKELLIVPGIEYSDAANVVHLPVWGDLPFLGEGLPPIGLLREVGEHGGSAMFAHPWRLDAWRQYDPEWRKYLTGVEVWNRKYDGIAPCREAVQLADRARLPGVAALDFHTRRQLFPLSLTLQSPGSGQHTIGHVYESLAQGRFDSMFTRWPIDRVTEGPSSSALRGLERLRRMVRRLIPRVR